MPNKKAAFTLIELIMVIVILTIIAGSSAAILIYFTQNTLFLPNQMNVQQAADVAMDMMIEGDDRAGGLRFAEITAFADDSVQFTDAREQQVQFRRIATGGPTTRNRLERKIGKGPWEVIPYYATGDLRVTRPTDGVLFSFFNATEGTTTDLDDIHRIRINLLAQSGSGEIADWEGQMALSSSVKLYRFNQPPTVVIDDVKHQPPHDRYQIKFTVDDKDGGSVSWDARLNPGDPGFIGDKKGNPVAGGSLDVPDSEEIYYYYPGPGVAATVTVEVDDGAGGTATDFRYIEVP